MADGLDLQDVLILAMALTMGRNPALRLCFLTSCPVLQSLLSPRLNVQSSLLSLLQTGLIWKGRT